MKTLTRLLLALPFAVAAFAADDQPTPFEKFIADHGVIVRKGLENKNFVNDPAALSWTSPKNGDNSSAINIGLGFVAWQSPDGQADTSYNVMPKVEYHRNTETDSKQDNFKAGATFTGILKQKTSDKDLDHYFELSAVFKNDRIKAGQGFSGSLSYTPAYSPLHLGYTGTGDFAYSVTPWIAFQAEQANDLTAGAPSGSVSRFKGSLELAMYPFNRTMKKNVELIVRHQVWLNQSRSGPFAAYKKTQQEFSASLNVYLDKDQQFGIGLDYTDGENPEDSQADQTLTTLSFKVKLGK